MYESYGRHALADDVLRTVSIEEACKANDIPVVKGNLILCPAHPIKMGKRNTNYGNCCIYRDTNTFTCHSCHTTGNVIALTMYAQNLSYSEAIDWLAARCAPELLFEGREMVRKVTKHCPFEDEELEDLGLMIHGKNICPIAQAPDKYTANHEPDDDGFDWTLEDRDLLSDSGTIIGKQLKRRVANDIVLCNTEAVDIKDLYEEDPQAFRAVVLGKAITFLHEYQKKLDQMQKMADAFFNKYQQKETDANKNDKKLLIDQIDRMMKQRCASAWHVVNYYKKVDANQAA